MLEKETISKEYQQLVKTTDEINDAVIEIKKNCLFELNQKKLSYLKCADDVLIMATQKLIEFMNYLIEMHKENEEPDYNFIPRKVFTKFKGNFDGYSTLNKKFKEIKKSLEEKEYLDKEQFDLLDRIVTVLDMERSDLFLNLRSARR